MVTGKEVASERSEGAGDWNVSAGGYFLNGRSSLRMIAAGKPGRWTFVAHRGDLKCGFRQGYLLHLNAN